MKFCKNIFLDPSPGPLVVPLAEPMLSILIVNWNTKEMLKACLSSIYRFPPSMPYEVIIVDNASPDGSADMVEQEFSLVRLIRSPKNIGYAAGNNRAFELAQGDYLLTLNPDTEFFDDALQRAVNLLCTNSSFGCVAPKLVGVSGDVQHSVRGFPSILGIVGDLTGIGRLFPKSIFGSYRLPAFDYEMEQDAPQPMGSFLLFRREALESVGDIKSPFDERLPLFFNEVDLLLRLRQSGWPCLYSPSIVVMHHGGMSTRQVKKNMIWESRISLMRYFSKHTAWPWRLFLPGLALLVYIGALIRAKGYYVGFRA